MPSPPEVYLFHLCCHWIPCLRATTVPRPRAHTQGCLIQEHWDHLCVLQGSAQTHHSPQGRDHHSDETQPHEWLLEAWADCSQAPPGVGCSFPFATYTFPTAVAFRVSTSVGNQAATGNTSSTTLSTHISHFEASPRWPCQRQIQLTKPLFRSSITLMFLLERNILTLQLQLSHITNQVSTCNQRKRWKHYKYTLWFEHIKAEVKPLLLNSSMALSMEGGGWSMWHMWP